MAGLKSVSPRARGWARIGAGIIVVAAIVATVGAGPFIRGLTSVSAVPVVVAVLLTGIATASAAWRWRVVAAGLGLELSWRGAIAAYYRSQFLNAVLPGGVVGDIHRAYRHGRRSGDVALAARAVVTERIAGQLVQCALTLVVLAALGLASPLHGLAWVIGGVAVLLVIATAIVATAAGGRRFLRRELRMLRQLFRDPGRSVQIVASSIVVVVSHTTVFVVACLATGVHASLTEMVALALIVLSAAALPINVGGWGPREGAAASAFAVVGLGAGAGVAASTTFGVLATIALLPGAAVLLVDRIRVARTRRPPSTTTEKPITERLIEEVNA
jgi:glycosyltransferase 2 family protein